MTWTVDDLDFIKTKGTLRKRYPRLSVLPWFDDCFQEAYITCKQRNHPEGLNALTYFINVFRDLIRKYIRVTDGTNKWQSARNGKGHDHQSFEVVHDDQEHPSHGALLTAIASEASACEQERSVRMLDKVRYQAKLTQNQYEALRSGIMGIEAKQMAQYYGCSFQAIHLRKKQGMDKLRKLGETYA